MCTFVTSGSSSGAELVAVRTMSPKSYNASPGITVSRSITQIPSPVASSSRTLLSFVSLCVTTVGISPARCKARSRSASAWRARAKSISDFTPAARLQTSASTAWSSARKRDAVSWNCGIVSWSGPPGRSTRSFWNSPKALAAASACAVVSMRSWPVARSTKM